MARYKFLLVIVLAAVLVYSMPLCDAKEKLPVDSKGYVGTLPDLTRDYVPQEKPEDKIEVISTPSKDFNSAGEIKPVPDDNPTFVNIILKPDKTSKYTNDLMEFIPLLENIFDLIEEGKSVQYFNAKVFYFNKSVEYFRDKYANKPESEYLTYKRLMELNIHTRTIALLRAEAEKYNPYLAYGSEGYIYNPNNIEEQLGYLKTEIEQTILLIREANE